MSAGRGITIACALVAACTIDPVDFAEKRCPCDLGFECEVARDRCVPAGSIARDDGSTMDSGTDAPVVPPDAAGPGRVVIGALRAAWSTPNSIRWEWTVTAGTAADLFEYQLVLGTTAEAAQSGDGADVWTDDRNPELGRFLLPRGSAEDPVTFTTTDELDPDTEYFAVLRAIDTMGAVSVSNVANARTSVTSLRSIDIFGDDWAAATGYYLPSCISVATSMPASGSAHVEYHHYCTAMGAACSGDGSMQICWENIRRQDLGISTAALTEGGFAQAYLEFSLSHDGMEPTWWSDVQLWVGSGHFTGAPLTYRNDGAYRRYQIKLTALRSTADDRAMTFADFRDGMGGQLPIELFWVGAAWWHGSTLRFDDVAIRW